MIYFGLESRFIGRLLIFKEEKTTPWLSQPRNGKISWPENRLVWLYNKFDYP